MVKKQIFRPGDLLVTRNAVTGNVISLETFIIHTLEAKSVVTLPTFLPRLHGTV